MVVICYFISILIAFILPLYLMYYVTLKHKELSRPFWVGFLTFLVFQLLTRIPLLELLSSQPEFIVFAQSNMLLYSLFLGLTAALFEEIGRFITMSFLMKNRHSTKDAIIFGVGHWACEAVILVGLSYLLYFISFGLTGIDTSIIWGGLERLFVLPIHVAASIMVMHFVKEKKPSYLLMAIGMHTIIDTALIPLQSIISNPIIIEGYVLVAGLLCCYFIYMYVKKWGLGKYEKADNDYSDNINDSQS